MTTAQIILQPNKTTEETLVAWLKAKSPEKLREFLATPWTASLLSSEAIEELSHELQREEQEGFVEVGQD